MKKSVDWVQLVKDAKKSSKGLERLYKELKPAFGYLYVLCNRACVEEAIQEAKIRIWKHLGKVDLSRSTEIKAYLCSLILWAMQDVLRVYSKQHFYIGIGHRDYANVPQKECPECPFDFDGLLQDYLLYIQRNGKIQGANAYFGKRRGVSSSRYSQMFRQARDSWIKRNRIMGNLN